MLPDNEKRLLIYKSNISKQNGSFIFGIFRSDKSIMGMDWGTERINQFRRTMMATGRQHCRLSTR